METTKPEDREKQPKSYAAAVEEVATKSDTPDKKYPSKTNRKANGKSPNKKTSVLKIVNTNGSKDSEKSDSSVKEEDEDERIGRPRMESKQEYSAEGLDDAPRTPPRQRGGRKKSSSTNSSKSETPEKKIEKPDIKEEMKLDPKVDLNILEKTAKENTVVYEESKNANGNKLISVKTTKDAEQRELNRIEEERRENRHLDSGRQAGKRWQQSAIRWAPLNVPLQRRLQTLVVLGHTVCIPICMATFFFLCAVPLFWPLLVPYLLYCIFSTASTSGTLSHRSEFIRSLPIWSLFASYFPARLHRSQILPPTRKYIFGYHPHGIISHGAFAAFGTEALGFSQLFPGIKNTLLTLDTNFRIPLYRDYALALGLGSVSKESITNLLSKGGRNGEGMGRAITIVVGGARESLDASPHTLRLVLRRRKGFIKMAIRTGADLVPVLSFGENDLYDQFNADSHPLIHKSQLLIKKFLGFTIPLFHARGVFNYDVGLMPYRRPLNVVVGRAIRVEMCAEPGREVVDRVHGEYVRELERLWETWKEDFAGDRVGEMEFVE